MAGKDSCPPNSVVPVIDEPSVDPNVHSASNSPFLAPTRLPVEHLSDPEIEHGEGDGSSNDDGLTPTGSDGVNISRRAQSPNEAGDELDEDGMLPRDKQRKTAYYDYASEKQMSHEEAKQFYQRAQLESRSVAGSTDDFGNLGNFEPLLRENTASTIQSPEEQLLGRTESIRSRQSNKGIFLPDKAAFRPDSRDGYTLQTEQGPRSPVA